MYICSEIFGEDDSFRCKCGEQYNQCCQECKQVSTCKEHCDYAHQFDCMVKVNESC